MPLVRLNGMFHGDVLTHTIPDAHWEVIAENSPEVRVSPKSAVSVICCPKTLNRRSSDSPAELPACTGNGEQRKLANAFRPGFGKPVSRTATLSCDLTAIPKQQSQP